MEPTWTKAVAPLLAASGPTITLAWLIAFAQRPSSVAEFITIGGMLSTLINPIATIYFVRPFRKTMTSRLKFIQSAQVSMESQDP
ncbi:hypothetical protein AAVH_17029 [Aphelenchoides avenae]|nr:hypothetical protein AAVH_17029 [Aphelenchus avenae]